jgi:selenide,water dikinase
MNPDILALILKGGADKVMEADALLVGGHSVEDPEPKYGLSVTGLVHPDLVRTNAGARVGDVLILTKPIGSGVLNTAVKNDQLNKEGINEVLTVMSKLNREAAEALEGLDVSAVTDVTGFGIGGHAYEMAHNSKVSMVIDHRMLPLMQGLEDLVRRKMVPGGTFKNIRYYKQFVEIDSSIDALYDKIIFDPQTSGGLLVSMPSDQAEIYVERLSKSYELPYAIVGEVIEQDEKFIYIK